MFYLVKSKIYIYILIEFFMESFIIKESNFYIFLIEFLSFFLHLEENFSNCFHLFLLKNKLQI